MSKALERVIAEQQKEIDRLRLMEKKQQRALATRKQAGGADGARSIQCIE